MLDNIATLIVVVLVVIVIGWLIIRLLTRSYVKTTATTAFVRTGGLRGASARPTVVMNGAAWVFGFLHRIKWVTLETMSIEVSHLEGSALITNDPQYVDLEARFFVKIGDDPESVSRAARTIGGEVVSEANVRRLVEPKINGAVRDIAATFGLNQLLEKRLDFIRQVQERLRTDLAENGLVLESVSILILRPTLQGQFSTDDILGAQVARANAAVIENALTEKTRLERTGSLDRARLDAEAERERLSIQEQIDVERATRAKNIALVRAAEEAASRIAQEERREEAERAHLLAERSLKEEEIENERLLVLLREQMQKAVELEKILRDEALALAEQERETHIAEATAAKLRATRDQIEADREREEAIQEATTIIEKAAAEREAEIELINIRLEAEKQAIETRSHVERETLRLREMAETERSVSVVQADATRTRAEAELDAARFAAIAERERLSASGLADVQVEMERIKVLEQEAEVTRLRLLAEAEGEKARAEALASHNAVAQELELARLDADVRKAIETARAQALGEAIGGMNLRLYGDSSTAQRLLQLVTAAEASDQAYKVLPSPARTALDNLAERIGGRKAGGGMRFSTFFDVLTDLLESHYPDEVDDDPPLGVLAEQILEEGTLDGEAAAWLKRIVAYPALSDLPISSALELAQNLVVE